MRLLLPLAQACRQTHDTDVRGNDMPAWEAAEALASPAKMLNRMGDGRKRGGRGRVVFTQDGITSGSSADWTASPNLRTDRPHWLHRLLECTSSSDVGSAGPICL